MTESRVRCNKFWWPTMSRDVATYIKNCPVCMENEPIAHVTFYVVMATPHWAKYIKDYLQGKSLDLPRWRKKTVAQEGIDYELIGDQLYKRGHDQVLRLCVPKEKYMDVLEHAHAGISGGHFAAETTAKTIMWSGLWWPTLHLDAELLVARCEECQRVKPPRAMNSMPLRPIMSARAFAKWGIDFASPIKPPARGSGAQYIIVATDYLTKWVEVKATTKNNARTTAIFLYENVFTRYGLPLEIVKDQGVHFVNEVVEFLLAEFMITHKRSAPYHPQTNRLAESINKTLCTTLPKVVRRSRLDWAEKLQNVLWAYRIAYKTATGATPFELVFGLNAITPLDYLVLTLRIAHDLEWTGHELSVRIDELKALDESRLLALVGMYAEKRRRKQWFDKNLKDQNFAIGDLALLYTLKKNKCKLKKRRLGPYVI